MVLGKIIQCRLELGSHLSCYLASQTQISGFKKRSIASDNQRYTCCNIIMIQIKSLHNMIRALSVPGGSTDLQKMLNDFESQILILEVFSQIVI